MKPRIGHIQYLNCFPLYYGLLSRQFPLVGELIKGTPAELNLMLRTNQLDLAPISSIEYARQADKLVLMPGIAVACNGPVGSIFLVSRKPLEELTNARIALTNTSATSQVLLKVLMSNYLGYHPEYFTSPPKLGSMLLEADAALLIGDDALEAAYRRPAGLYIYDLGNMWKEYTGECMVFAVWAINREFASQHRDLVAEIKNTFVASMHYSLEHLGDAALEASRYDIYDADYLANYLTTLKYDFDGPFQHGLLRYYQEAHAIGELDQVPNLEFVEV